MPHSEIQELLGAYALDAVDADEAATIENHLTTCPRCAAEVREHREVASMLAYAGAAAPAGMWDRLAAVLDEAPPAAAAPDLRLGSRTGSRATAGRRRRGLGMAAAVAAAAVFAGLGAVGGVELQSALRDPGIEIEKDANPLLREAAAAALAEGARSVHLVSPDQRPVADAVISADGTGYLIDKGAPPLPDGRTYQLWAVAGGQKLSVGVLGGKIDVVSFRGPSSFDALALTVEQAPGVVASANQAVGYGLVRQ